MIFFNKEESNKTKRVNYIFFYKRMKLIELYYHIIEYHGVNLLIVLG